MITIEIPGEPVPKARPKFARVGRGDGSRVVAYTPSGTRGYESQIKLMGKLAMGEAPLLTGALSLDVVATRSLLKSMSGVKRKAALEGRLHPTTRPDADNYLKIAADALIGIVYADDSQLVEQHVCKIYGEKPGLVITIKPIGEGETNARSETRSHDAG